jgi:hypothetical protein
MDPRISLDEVTTGKIVPAWNRTHFIQSVAICFTHLSILVHTSSVESLFVYMVAELCVSWNPTKFI